MAGYVKSEIVMLYNSTHHAQQAHLMLSSLKEGAQ